MEELSRSPAPPSATSGKALIASASTVLIIALTNPTFGQASPGGFALIRFEYPEFLYVFAVAAFALTAIDYRNRTGTAWHRFLSETAQQVCMANSHALAPWAAKVVFDELRKPRGDRGAVLTLNPDEDPTRTERATEIVYSLLDRWARGESEARELVDTKGRDWEIQIDQGLWMLSSTERAAGRPYRFTDFVLGFRPMLQFDDLSIRLRPTNRNVGDTHVRIGFGSTLSDALTRRDWLRVRTAVIGNHPDFVPLFAAPILSWLAVVSVGVDLLFGAFRMVFGSGITSPWLEAAGFLAR